jgi:hypothetical protein
MKKKEEEREAPSTKIKKSIDMNVFILSRGQFICC